MPTKRTLHRAPPGFVSKIPTTIPKNPQSPDDSETEPRTMRHPHIRAGSKRSEGENDNPNVTPIRDSQPDDPGEGTGVGPKHEAPDTAGISTADEVERASRRAARKEAVVAGLFAGGAASAFIGVLWLLVWLAG